MKMAGAQILIRGLNFKPGMAGAYGIMEKPGAGSPAKLPVMALSGNPAACMTAFRLVCAPVLKKLAGWSDPYPEEVDCELLADFPKASRGMRILRGRKVYRDGKVYFDFEFTPAYPAEQVTFRAYLRNDEIETILMENLAQ